MPRPGVPSLGADGFVGVTAIANSPHDADALYRKVEATLAEAATSAQPRPEPG